MKFDENKRYTNKEIIQSMNMMQRNLSSEIGAVGKVVKELGDRVVIVDDWRKARIAIEQDRQLRSAIDKNPNQQIIKELVKVIGIITGTLVTVVGAMKLS